MVVLAAVGFLVWASAYVVGDATSPDEPPRVGAAADFGAVRAPVLPVEAVPFATLTPIQNRDLGRLVHLSGVAETGVRARSVWVRTNDGFRILARFEPEPPPELLEGIRPGAGVSLDGYLQNLARAEFYQIADSLNVQIPRPPPARKFGDLPDPSFARVDSLFIKNFYISIRPEALQRETPPQATS